MNKHVEPWNGELQILSLDGGGIRGLYVASMLAAFERDLSTEITKHFDLIVGTSTGGIIALALGLGMKPKEIVDFYATNGGEIFRNRTRLRSVMRLLLRKYSGRPLERALRGALGERLLGDSTKRLVIPSFDLDTGKVHVFKTPHHPDFARDWQIPAWKVGMATSAAPTYFPAFRGVEGARLIDGGVWANNPCMVGLVEGVSVLGAKLDQIRMLSFGTTSSVDLRKRSLNSGGAAVWARSAPDVIMRGQAVSAVNEARHLLGEDRFLRIDPVVPSGALSLDKLDSARLKALAATFSRESSREVRERFLDHIAGEYAPYYNGSKL